VSTGADLRYLGPSSGIFFTRFVLAGLVRKINIEKSLGSISQSSPAVVPSELLLVQARDLPRDRQDAKWLSAAYFETVHLQFPFLHESNHVDTLQRLYDGEDVGFVGKFHVFMVLAIGATILGRREKLQLFAEGYFASAMTYLDRIFQTVSIGGVQCILLLEMYTSQNSSSGLSLWTLHYHCLATAIELGLQRNAPDGKFSFLEQEIRTRTFWCVYSMDRCLSILLGRPVGLMDEQCDLRVIKAQSLHRSRLTKCFTVTARRRGRRSQSAVSLSPFLWPYPKQNICCNPPLQAGKIQLRSEMRPILCRSTVSPVHTASHHGCVQLERRYTGPAQKMA
jgi:hypothetical protein